MSNHPLQGPTDRERKLRTDLMEARAEYNELYQRALPYYDKGGPKAVPADLLEEVTRARHKMLDCWDFAEAEILRQVDAENAHLYEDDEDWTDPVDEGTYTGSRQKLAAAQYMVSRLRHTDPLTASIIEAALEEISTS